MLKLNKNHLIFAIAIFLISLVSLSAGPAYISWEVTLDNNKDDMGYGIASDSNNNIVIVGSTISSVNRSRDYLIAKYDNNGKLMWEKTYDTGSRDEAYHVVVDSEDNIIVTGKAGKKFLTIKYDKNGVLIWKSHDGMGSDDGALYLTVDSKDNIIVTGSSKIVVFGYYTIKYDKNGKMLWRKYWRPAETELGRAVTTDSEDNVIVLGVATNAKDTRAWDDYTFYAFKYDENGKQLWEKKYGTSYDSSEPFSVLVDSSGNIFLIGFASNNHDYDFYVIKIDKDGKFVWDKTYDNYNSDKAYGATIDSEDNIYLVGVTSDSNLNEDIYTIKIDKKGKLLWEKIYDKTKNDIGYGITLDNENNICIVSSTKNQTWDAMIIKYLNN
jgi:hypothetical protein